MGKKVAEYVVKKNHDNYHVHYPEKAFKYTEKGFSKQEVVEDSPKKQKIDPMKVNPHILMKAVDRQLNLTDLQKFHLYEKT